MKSVAQFIIGGFIALMMVGSIFLLGIEDADAGQNCPDSVYVKRDAGCPPPPPINGQVKSTKKFLKECAWLPFPVGAVGQPIVFFTRESDARCIGNNWRRPCPDCQAWIEGRRGPVNGPAKNAVLAIRLHDGMTGISVPRSELARIKKETGWCWFGKSGIYDSHSFSNKNPF